ncbi:MAG TPA: hypothetical protein PLI27_00015 [Ignavibacteriales bacterium]|nr:hypothetical protein [Ignavibacteriales bacterium]HPD66449.1 hypothetical protein [Ignavibacteriales bacterium]HRR19230.1 hypothetical protein [Ignavibacteriales bacterium]
MKKIILIVFFATIISYAQEKISPALEAVQEFMLKHSSEFRKQKTENTIENEKVKAEKAAKFEKFQKQFNINQRYPRKSVLMNANKIKTVIHNYGGIGLGYGGRDKRELGSVVWKDMPYIFQCSPIVGASVVGADGKRYHIITDGIDDYPNNKDQNASGDTLYQWQPLPGYDDPNQMSMATNPAPDLDGDGKPDSWPREWYSEALGKYVWPGYLKVGGDQADLEAYWAMDDRENVEFLYYPFKNDLTRKGIGIQIDGRAFQWANPAAENAIFFVYTITNISDFDIDTLLFGFYGDPDVGYYGRGSNEPADDIGYFVPPRNVGSYDVSKIPVYARSMIYLYDSDKKGDKGLPVYYVGIKFLESPSNSTNGIDDDGDGMIDESQDNDIDDDGDWNPLTDDVGIDGVPNTGDEGEGDGKPTKGRRLPDGRPDPLAPGEPNYEYTDLDEADMIGLTSFSSWAWNAQGDPGIKNDEDIWNRNKPGNFGQVEEKGNDIVFTFGSGYISLKKGESKRISVAILFGETLNDLLLTAETVQKIYNKNYNFYKAPEKPNLTAIPGDKKVTLYWDAAAEESIDPITGKDFQGYVLYRSEDPTFSDLQTITDGRGNPFLYRPHTKVDGSDCRWDIATTHEPFTDINGNGEYDSGEPFVDYNGNNKWDATGYPDPWVGYHPVQYPGRGVSYYMGDNTGLVHYFVDSNNVINGKTYYYALCSYDRGDDQDIPPSECTKKITVNPITRKLEFDVNTVAVTPGPRASGYSPSKITSNDTTKIGISTANVSFEVVNDLLVKDNKYSLMVADTFWTVNNTKINKKNYSVIDSTIYQDRIQLFGTKNANLSKKNILNDNAFSVKSLNGTVYTKNVDYIINFDNGTISRIETGNIPDNAEVLVTYHYFPIYQSVLFNNEDANPIFDGILLKVKDEDKLDIDYSKTTWTKESKSTRKYDVRMTTKGTATIREEFPGDYKIIFSDQVIDTVTYMPTKVKKPVKFSVRYTINGTDQRIECLLYEAVAKPVKNGTWSYPGDELILLKPGTSIWNNTHKLTWGVTIVDTGSIAPTSGDVFEIKTKIPLTKDDKYVLKTKKSQINVADKKSLLDNVYVVPNPYVGFNEIEPTDKLPGQIRGERRIYFENLPAECTIKIFTIAGDHVTTLYHNSTFENSRAYWNLLNKDGYSVAYGIYLAHIEAPNIGSKTIKFAIIK